jgi:hypothetical protein
MGQRPGQRPRQRGRLVRLAWGLSLWSVATTTVVAATATQAPAQAQGVVTATAACSANPGQDGCALTGISLSTSSLTTGSLNDCSTACELNVGSTVELPVQAIYNDGSEGPLDVVAGSTGPQATFSTAPVPSGAFTLSGVVNGAGGGADVQLTADESTSAPAVVVVSYQGLDAFSPPITAGTSPTCGSAGQPQCFEVNGALLTVEAVVTGTASDTPVAGAVADIVQAGPASGTGAFVGSQPCYPQGGGGTCGPVPAGDPATASSATCTTLSSGSCSLTAMWDGSDESFTHPDTLALYPPPGYLVAGVSGCTPVNIGGLPLTCGLTVPDGSNPLTVTFGLEPVSVLTVNLAGPLEPVCEPTTCLGPTYDNDAVDGATVTATPAGATPGGPSSCQVEGGIPGGTTSGASGQDASCTLALPPGTYSVAMPSTINTPDSEVNIGLAYITGEDPQPVTLAPGQDETVNFASAYEPTITINVAGPEEPTEQALEGTSSAVGTIYDNDAVDGTTVTVTPAAGTPGSPASCQVEGGYSGDNVDYGAPASCNVGVLPGTYTVSVPSTIETPYSEVGIPLAYVSGAATQTVTVAVGNNQDVNFSTVYEPTITVNLDGPLEPACVATKCSTQQMVYDNDAVAGTTVTVTPGGGTSGPSQTCQLQGGYPGDNVDYGQPSSCIVGEPPGTYSVSLPSTIETPYSEVGIPVAYVTGQDPQSVTLSPGQNAAVNFASAYEPTISITVAGPLEPTCSTGACPGGGKVYDDDAVNGTTVTVKPTGATSGQATSCQVQGGEPDGTTGARQEASCDVGVSPGTYKVSVPARIAPSPDYGWGYIDVKGPGSQQVTVGSGGANSVAFTTAYAAVDNVGSGLGSARTKDGLLTASGSGGTGTVTVAEYGSDPEGPSTFNNYSNSNDFFDVSVASDSTFQKLVATVCGLDGNPDAMSWWDTAAAGDGGWEPVAPVSAVSSLKPGCLSVTITRTTSPSVTELSGTVFGVALRLAPQRVNFNPPGPTSVVVGDSYKPVATASSRLPVVFSVGPTSTKGACALEPTGAFRFTGTGTCVLDADQGGNSHWAAALAKREISVLAGKPVAEAAYYSTSTGYPLKVTARDGVLAKDSVNGATISAHTSPAHGTLTLLGSGAFTYAPRPTFSGTDHFTYTLRNSLGRSTATVSIEVGDVVRGRR